MVESILDLPCLRGTVFTAPPASLYGAASCIRLQRHHNSMFNENG